MRMGSAIAVSDWRLVFITVFIGPPDLTIEKSEKWVCVSYANFIVFRESKL